MQYSNTPKYSYSEVIEWYKEEHKRTKLELNSFYEGLSFEQYF